MDKMNILIDALDFTWELYQEYREGDNFKEGDEKSWILGSIFYATLVAFLINNKTQVLIDACDKTLDHLSIVYEAPFSEYPTLSPEEIERIQRLMAEYSENVSNLKTIADKLCGTLHTPTSEEMDLLHSFFNARRTVRNILTS